MSSAVSEDNSEEPVSRKLKLIEVVTTATQVFVSIEDKERRDARSAFLKLNNKKYVSNKAGTYYLSARAIDFKKNIYLEDRLVVTIGEGPEPEPDQDFRVLMIYESADLLPAKQRAIFSDPKVRNYMNDRGEWRILDKDTTYEDPNTIWAQWLKLPRQTVPWIIISGQGFPLPEDVKSTLELLEKYGG
jgi:hypothetical protein